MKKCFLLCLIFIYSGLFAQGNLKESGSWLTMSNKFQISNKIHASQISQMRRVGFLNETQVILLKPSINYKFSKHISFGLGYVYFRSYPNGVHHSSIKKEENRIWQHLTISSKLGLVSVSNRLIFEERFKDIIDQTTIPNRINGKSYTQRFRYRLEGSYKIKTLKNGKSVLVKASNELRIRFKTGLSEPEFDQNNFRSYVGYKFHSNSSIWIGYGRDYNSFTNNLYLSNDILLVTLNYDIDLRVKK